MVFEQNRSLPALRADGLDFVEAAKQIVVEVTFLLEAPAREALAALTSEQLNATTVLITKDYSGYFEIQFPEQPIVFPDRLHPNSADELCDRLLPTVHAQAGETRSFTPPTRDRSQSSSVDDLAAQTRTHANASSRPCANTSPDKSRPDQRGAARTALLIPSQRHRILYGCGRGTVIAVHAEITYENVGMTGVWFLGSGATDTPTSPPRLIKVSRLPSWRS